MQLREIRAELKARGFDGFEDSDLDRYINWGYFSLAGKVRVSGIEEDIPFSLDAGSYFQPFSALPIVPKGIRHVSVVTSGAEAQLEPMSQREFWSSWAPWGFSVPSSTVDSGHTGEPVSYFIYAQAIIILPAPSDGRDFVASTWRSISELVEEDDPHILPIDFEESLILEILRVCHTRANETSRAESLKQDIEEQIEVSLTEEAFQSEELQERVDPDDGWF